MSKEKWRVPKLRFPGFTEDWEQRKLSEVTTCFDNLRVPVTASDRVPGKIPYYGANGIQDYVSGHTHSGEFVLIAEDGANDLNDYPIQYVNGAIWVNNHAHVIAGYKEKLENKFLSYSLKTVKMTTFIVGSGRSKLNLKALLEIPISMPNYDEQCVIGKFIETIDINITLHQRKLDNLKLKKKALLQKLFPRNGERYPELRFPGFTDAWEQRKLSELATMNARIGWQNLRTSEFLDSGDYLLITGTDFDNGRIKYNTCHYVEKKRFDQDTKIQLSTGSILITKDGTLGKVALIEELPKPATLNAGVFNVRVKDDAVLSYKYLYHYLKAPFLMKYVTANATGGTIKHLNQSILVDFPIPITEKQEQDRIAKLLDSLESIITLHQRKLEHLQIQKKSLLQKLFV